jgi:hypothetical protein
MEEDIHLYYKKPWECYNSSLGFFEGSDMISPAVPFEAEFKMQQGLKGSKEKTDT